jgi:hypothetical protein
MTARIICKTQKFEKGCKLAKYLGIYLFIKKIANDISKCSVKEDLHIAIKIMHV